MSDFLGKTDSDFSTIRKSVLYCRVHDRVRSDEERVPELKGVTAAAAKLSSPSSSFLRLPSWPLLSGVLRDWPCQDVKVFLALSAHIDRRNRCHPSMTRLQALLGWSRKHISQSVRRLWCAGAIDVRYRQRQSTVYELAFRPEQSVEFAQRYHQRRAHRKPLMLPARLHQALPRRLHRTRLKREQDYARRQSMRQPLQPVVAHVLQNIIQVKDGQQLSVKGSHDADETQAVTHRLLDGSVRQFYPLRSSPR